MSAKYYRRGQREYYQVGPTQVIRIVNKEIANYITIDQIVGDDGISVNFLAQEALEGKEITKEEFKIQFEEASRLIVLEE